jgi:hypothetical protein
VHRASYESPLLLEVGLLSAIAAVPWIVRRWTAAVEDLVDLPDRVIDTRGKRREAREKRGLAEAERKARYDELEYDRNVRDLRREELESNASIRPGGVRSRRPTSFRHAKRLKKRSGIRRARETSCTHP